MFRKFLAWWRLFIYNSTPQPHSWFGMDLRYGWKPLTVILLVSLIIYFCIVRPVIFGH